MEQNIIDLDILRPEPRYVILAKKKIDVSFLPCGILFDINEKMNQLATVSGGEIEEIRKGGDVARKSYEMAIEICAIFCGVQHELMTKEWFRKNVSAEQVNMLLEEIRKLLEKELAAAVEPGDDSKNLIATEAT